MAFIRLNGVTVEFPVYNASSRSLKNAIIGVATGGSISRRDDGVVTVRGLEDFSLSISEGERIGIIGHNGAGKTTLLRVLSGIYRPPAGWVESEGEVVSLINIGLGIDPEATGRENIALRAAMMGMTPAVLRQKFDEIAEFTGLGDFLDMPFRTYSTGMQLRLAFSTSTAIEPDILLMDEWLSTGDENFRGKASERLQRLVSATKILVLASHTRELLECHCTRIVWLEHGRIRADGPPAEILPAYFG